MLLSMVESVTSSAPPWTSAPPPSPPAVLWLTSDDVSVSVPGSTWMPPPVPAAVLSLIVEPMNVTELEASIPPPLPDDSVPPVMVTRVKVIAALPVLWSTRCPAQVWWIANPWPFTATAVLLLRVGAVPPPQVNVISAARSIWVSAALVHAVRKLDSSFTAGAAAGASASTTIANTHARPAAPSAARLRIAVPYLPIAALPGAFAGRGTVTQWFRDAAR